MSLKNILLDISSVLGLDITDDDEKAYHIKKINEAAEELYRSNDIPGCLREQLFKFDDSETYQITLPYYVDKLRAMRFYDTNGGQIGLEDMRPRYHMHRWGSNGRLKFKIKQTTLLSREISNASVLTFTLRKVETANITINVIGKTLETEKNYELVTIVAGQLTASTVGSYESYTNIEKTALNNYDIVMTDVDDNEMGVIPNNQLSPKYQVIQIREDDFAPLTTNSYPLNIVEVLYKTAFEPFVNLYDEFPAPNCDKLIFWQFLVHYGIYKPENNPIVAGAAAQVDKILRELNVEDGEGKELKVQYAPNPMFDAQNNLCEDMYYSGPSPLIEYLPPS